MRCYNNGILELPSPVTSQDTLLVVHPFMTYPLSDYPDEYVESLLNSIESGWKAGRQPVFMLQTADPQRFWVVNPSVTCSSRRFVRHNRRVAATLEEARDYLSRHLPKPLMNQSGYLVSEHADPTRIRFNQLSSVPLDNVLLYMKPNSLTVHGEIFYPHQKPSRNCYGCVNNVLGISLEIGIPTEMGTVLSHYRK